MRKMKTHSYDVLYWQVFFDQQKRMNGSSKDCKLMQTGMQFADTPDE